MEWLINIAAALSSRLGRSSALIRALRPTYDRVLDFFYAEDGIPAKAGTETFLVCSRVRKFVSLESDVYDYLKANVQPGDTILDVGAFLGLYAVLAARWAGARGRVIAFEPTPATLPLLHRHLAMNGVQQTVTPLSCAVGRTHGVVDFFQHVEAYRNAVGVKDPIIGEAIPVKVPMLSIDEACALFDAHPDLMRIDVQGLEAEVLQGAMQTIKRRPKLKIIMEVHPQLWPLHGLDETKFRTLLASLGLEASAPDGGPPVYGPDAHLVLQSVERGVVT